MSGFGYFFLGLRLLKEPGIRPFVLLPILVNVVLFALLTWLLVGQAILFTTWLQGALPGWLDWLVWLFWPVVVLAWLVVYGFSFAMISNTIAAPFYGLLAESVQRRFGSDVPETPLTVEGLLSLTGRTLAREGQKLLYLVPRLLGIAIITLPLYFIPAAGLLATLIWFTWGAWSLALQNIDYAADNNAVSFVALRRTMARKRTPCLTFGAAAVAAAAIPLFNLIAVPAAVAGGTALWHERLREDAPERPNL